MGKDRARSRNVPRLKKVKKGGHAWEAQLADKDRGVKASITFFLLNKQFAFLVYERKGLEDCVDMRKGRYWCLERTYL